MQNSFKSLIISGLLSLGGLSVASPVYSQALLANNMSFTTLAVGYLPIYLSEGVTAVGLLSSDYSDQVSSHRRDFVKSMRDDAIRFLADREKSTSLDQTFSILRAESEEANNMSDEQLAGYIIVLSEAIDEAKDI